MTTKETFELYVRLVKEEEPKMDLNEQLREAIEWTLTVIRSDCIRWAQQMLDEHTKENEQAALRLGA